MLLSSIETSWDPSLELASEIIENLFKNTLVKPLYNDLTITILPGWNMYDIDTYLSEKKIIET